MKSSCTILLLMMVMQMHAQLSGSVEAYYFDEGKERGNGVFGRAMLMSKNSWTADVRINYDEDQTFSAYCGRRFGDDFGPLEWEIAPALGFIAGNVKGLALSASTSLSYGRFDFWSQMNAHRQWNSGYSFYTWTEATYEPVPWLFAGGCVQNGQLPVSGRYFAYGVVAGFVLGRFEVPVYALRNSGGSMYFMSGCSISWVHQRKSLKNTNPVQF